MNRVIAKVEVDGQCPVEWLQGVATKRHVITYGKQVRKFGKRDSVGAAEEFGLCVRHALECAGLLEI